MSRLCSLLVLAALAHVGCSAPPKTPVAVADAEPPAFSPDQDVPLTAPDEAAAAKTTTRLTTVKRIGGGPDDTSVDGPHRGTTGQAATRATTSTAAPRARAYYSRGSSAYSSSSGTGTTSFNGTAGVSPAAGGNFPSAPSLGSAAAH